MKINKYLIIFLTLLLGLTSCHNDNEEDKNSSIDKPVLQQTYNVKWMSLGEVIKEESVKKNTIPNYSGDLPTKEGSHNAHWVFKGWDPKPTPIKEDMVFTAIFKEELNEYTISFNTLGGNELDPYTAKCGTQINSANDLPKPSKDGFHFTGWTKDDKNIIPVKYPFILNDDITLYASYNTELSNSDFIKNLIQNTNINPYQFIPETLQSKNYTIEDDSLLNYNYKETLAIENINENGYLDEWNGVLTCLDEAKQVGNTLKTVDVIMTISMSAYNDYIDSNPQNADDFEFKYGGAYITIKKIDSKFYYTLDLDDKINKNKINISLSLDTITDERNGKIVLDKSNTVKYKTTKNSMILAVNNTKDGQLYLKIDKQDNNDILGSINKIKDNITKTYYFNISNDYTYVIGDSSTNIIKEIYNSKNGFPVFSINKTTNKINFNMGNIDTFISMKQNATDNNKYLINDIELNYGIDQIYGITFVNKYYNFNQPGILNTTIPTIKKHILPMFFVDIDKVDNLKTTFEENNPTIKFNLTTDVSLINDYLSIFDEEINNFSKFKNKYNKEYIEQYINYAI